MYAIVDIAGKQYKVAEGKKVYVDKLNTAEGESITFDKVLLTDTGSDVKIGTPNVSGASISAKVLGHVKGDKVIVFKKKRRKGYVVKNGHRQQYTQVLIENINA
jgi:large subunit ribosomal protein L21